jgi:hypothetical protein
MINKPVIHLFLDDMINIIENGSVEEFITVAKEYCIFQETTNTFYNSMCERIRQRLTRENLSEDVLR